MRLFLIAVLLCLPVPTAAEPYVVKVTTTAEGDGSYSLMHEVVVDAPPEEVWQAISTAEGWKTWAVPVAWDVSGEPGVIETSYNPAAKPGDAGNIKNAFRVEEAGKRLGLLTIKAPEGFPHWDLYRKVANVFVLESVAGGKTRVRLTGTNYAGSEAGKQLLSFFQRGNSTSLEALRNRFLEGPIDWSKKLSESARR